MIRLSQEQMNVLLPAVPYSEPSSFISSILFPLWPPWTCPQPLSRASPPDIHHVLKFSPDPFPPGSSQREPPHLQLCLLSSVLPNHTATLVRRHLFTLLPSEGQFLVVVCHPPVGEKRSELTLISGLKCRELMSPAQKKHLCHHFGRSR